MNKLLDWIKRLRPTFERFGACLGLRVPLGFGRQIELWHAPKGGVIEPHVHEHVDTHIFYLWGKVDVMVDGRTARAVGPIRRRKSTGRWVWAHRNIVAGQVHSARILGNRGIFLVLERCRRGYHSASQDFRPV